MKRGSETRSLDNEWSCFNNRHRRRHRGSAQTPRRHLPAASRWRRAIRRRKGFNSAASVGSGSWMTCAVAGCKGGRRRWRPLFAGAMGWRAQTCAKPRRKQLPQHAINVRNGMRYCTKAGTTPILTLGSMARCLPPRRSPSKPTPGKLPKVHRLRTAFTQSGPILPK